MSELKWSHLFSLNQSVLAALRLLVIPATAVALVFLLPFGEETLRKVLLVVAIMPSAIASVILSEVYGGDIAFSSVGVLVTHLLSLITIPMWLFLLLR